jgi:hypothetical protein
MKADFGAIELPSVVVQPLRNIRAARKEFLPLTANLSTVAALVFQIQLREIFLNEILAIRARLRNRSSDVIAGQGLFRINARRTRSAQRRKCRTDRQRHKR